MGYWSRIETELLINAASQEPNLMSVRTNWARYVNRLDQCEAFQEQGRFEPQQGGVEVHGTIDQSEYTFLHFRQHMTDEQQAQWETEKAKLPELVSTPTEYRPAAYERELLIHGEITDGYWLTVQTDMAVWIRRMERNPFAVLVAEQLYRAAREDDEPGEDEDLTDRHRTYMIPRQLLTIRRNRPQLSEERKQELSKRMSALRERIGAA